MSANKVDDAGMPSKLTEREIEILVKAWLCMKSPPELDLDKLAQMTNYANPRSINNIFTVIRKKLSPLAATADGQEQGEEAGGGDGVPALAFTTTKSRAAGSKHGADAGKCAGGPRASAPRKRKGGVAGAEAEASSHGNDGDVDEATTPHAKRPARRAKKDPAKSKPMPKPEPTPEPVMHDDDMDVEVKAAEKDDAKKGEET